MAKKIFLAVFAISILALNIGLRLQASRDNTQRETDIQQAIRLQYIEDQSPSVMAFDPLGRLWVYESDEVLNKNGALVVYQGGNKIERYTEKESPVLSWLPKINSQIEFASDGTAWVGTGGNDGGLATFDGDAWTTFTTASDLPSDWVTALAVDTLGRAWVGLYENGLVLIDKGEWQFFNTGNSGLSVNTIHDIAFDGQGKAWITTDRHGVNIFDGVDWQILNVDNSGLAHNQTDKIIFDDRGRAWIATWVDISVYDPERNSWLHYPQVDADAGYQNMFFDSIGRFWALRGGIIHVFDGKKWEKYIDPTFPFQRILPDLQGNILMEGGGAIRSVEEEDVNFNLQPAFEGKTKIFIKSGGLVTLTLILVFMWLAAFFSAWWTMVVTLIIGLPVYLIWNTIAAEFSGMYIWNPGTLFSLSILVFGTLGKWLKRPGRKLFEWLGIGIGLGLGIILGLGTIILPVILIFMSG